MAYDDQECEGKMNTLRGLGASKKMTLIKKEIFLKWGIGEAGQKEKLTYVSLMQQIIEGKAAGYDQDEIVNGVIREMVSSLRLRKGLEITTGLNLNRLLSFL